MMQMEEFSQRTGLSKKTIHFYIDKGLLHPKKNPENQYYLFDESTLQESDTIRILRKAGVPVTLMQDMFRYPGAVNYFFYKTMHKLKQEVLQKQTQMENITLILEQISPNATPTQLDHHLLEQLVDQPSVSSLDQLYPLNESYLAACFLLIPFVKATPTHYRRFLWDRIAQELKTSCKEGCIILEKMIDLLSIDQLHQASKNVYDLLSQVLQADDLVPFQQHLLTCCKTLLQDPLAAQKWKLLYQPLLHPLASFYHSSMNLLDEYNDEAVSQLSSKMQKIIRDSLPLLHEEGMDEALRNEFTSYFDLTEPYTDLFLLFSFFESFYAHPSLEQIRTLLFDK